MASHKYDLVIVGAGSGNMLLTGEFAGWRVAVAEGDRFGGTCLNRGCIPSKMLIHTADVAQTVRHAGRFGIGAKWAGADWPAIRDRVFGRIDPLHEQAVAHRRAGDVDVFLGEARFGGRRCSASAATRSTPSVSCWQRVRAPPFRRSRGSPRFLTSPRTR